MGVSGLTQHVSRKLSRWVGRERHFPCSPPAKERTPLLVDLSGWGWTLYLTLLRRSPVWGVPGDQRACFVQRFLRICHLCQLDVVFVADGASPPLKEQTRQERRAARRRHAEHYRDQVAALDEQEVEAAAASLPPVLGPFLPPAYMWTLVTLLQSFGAHVIFSPGEADALAAHLGRQRHGIVLTNDSDFFMLQSQKGGCLFAQLREMVTLARPVCSLSPPGEECTRVDAWFDLNVALTSDSDSDSDFDSDEEVEVEEAEGKGGNEDERDPPSSSVPLPSRPDPRAARQRLTLLRLTVYDPARLAQLWRVPVEVLPVVSAFTENDYVSDGHKQMLHQALGTRFDRMLSSLLVLIREEHARLGCVSYDGPALQQLSAAVLARLISLSDLPRGRRSSSFHAAAITRQDSLPPSLQAKYDRLWPGIVLCLDTFMAEDVDPALSSLFQKTGQPHSVEGACLCGDDNNDDGNDDAGDKQQKEVKGPSSLNGITDPLRRLAMSTYEQAYFEGHFPPTLLSLLAYRTLHQGEFFLVDPRLPPVQEGEAKQLYRWSVAIVMAARDPDDGHRPGRYTEPGCADGGRGELEGSVSTPGESIGRSDFPLEEPELVWNVVSGHPLLRDLVASSQERDGTIPPPVLLPESVRQVLLCRILQMHPSLAQLMNAETRSPYSVHAHLSHPTATPVQRAHPANPLQRLDPSLVLVVAVLTSAIRDMTRRAPSPDQHWTQDEIQAAILIICASHLPALDAEGAQAVLDQVHIVRGAVSGSGAQRRDDSAPAPASAPAPQPSRPARPTLRGLHLASSLHAHLLAAHTLHASLLLPPASRRGMVLFDLVLFQQAVCVSASWSSSRLEMVSTHDQERSFLLPPLPPPPSSSTPSHQGLRQVRFSPHSTPQVLLDCVHAAVSGPA